MQAKCKKRKDRTKSCLVESLQVAVCVKSRNYFPTPAGRHQAKRVIIIALLRGAAWQRIMCLWQTRWALQQRLEALHPMLITYQGSHSSLLTTSLNRHVQ